MADFTIEQEIENKGYKLIAGIDEAGRGPLAGPVVAAAVILDNKSELFDEICDSKKISESKREQLFDFIVENAIDYSIQFVDEKIIDEINILQATMKAMKLAVFALERKPGFLLIDGNYLKCKEIEEKFPFKTIVKGDNLSTSIAAASILAKVSRDNWMKNVADKEFPIYNFSKNKGYPTKKHIEIIKSHGICKYHRKSFLKSILGSEENTLF